MAKKITGSDKKEKDAKATAAAKTNAPVVETAPVPEAPVVTETEPTAPVAEAAAENTAAESPEPVAETTEGETAPVIPVSSSDVPDDVLTSTFAPINSLIESGEKLPEVGSEQDPLETDPNYDNEDESEEAETETAEPEVPVESVVPEESTSAVEATASVMEETVVEETKPELLCSWNDDITTTMLGCLDVLNSVSSRQIDAIAKARSTLFHYLIIAITTGPDAAMTKEFYRNFLNAVAKRPHVLDKNRAFIGFSNMTALSKSNVTMYQLLWKLILDTANPLTRAQNLKTVRWSALAEVCSTHRKGNDMYNFLIRFYNV